MRILLVNPPHPSIGSRIPHEHLPPLGLLSIGGPLLDAGHEVQLVDGEFGPMTPAAIAKQARAFGPQVIMVGHSGSTSGHPSAMEVTRALRAVLPDAQIVYGGVFPTYHWREILADEPQIDLIVRGEGEQTILDVVEAWETGGDIESVRGIATRRDGVAWASPQGTVIQDLDAYRVGWELIDFARYSYWGDRRAVVVQFSRGCPHSCSYCGQRGFWRRWRHRDPRKFAAELAELHRRHGVEVINFADENPTASREAWREFLEALIAENVPLTLVGSTRADDIVRDADILHLYKKAGVVRWLLGIENYNPATLEKIGKEASIEKDRRAIQLLREHDIISMATYVVGFEEETDRDYMGGLRQLLRYDPDQIQMLYLTPHRWTPVYETTAGRRVIQQDQGKWDYKHQVLAIGRLPAWRVLLWVKVIEAIMQLRPKSIWRVLAHRDRAVRAGMRWYYSIGRKVWGYEIWKFLVHDRRGGHQAKATAGSARPTLRQFWGEQLAEVEAADAPVLSIKGELTRVTGRPLVGPARGAGGAGYQAISAESAGRN